MQRHAELNSENSGKKAEHQTQLADSSHLNRMLQDSQSFGTPLFSPNPRFESLSSGAKEGKGNSIDKIGTHSLSEHLPNLSLGRPHHAEQHPDAHAKVREWKADGTGNTQFRNPFRVRTLPAEHALPSGEGSLKGKDQKSLDANIAEIKARIATGGMTPANSFIQPTWMNRKGENLDVVPKNSSLKQQEEVRPESAPRPGVQPKPDAEPQPEAQLRRERTPFSRREEPSRPAPNPELQPRREEPLRPAPNPELQPRREEPLRPAPNPELLPRREEPLRPAPNPELQPRREEPLRPAPNPELLPRREEPLRPAPNPELQPRREEPLRPAPQRKDPQSRPNSSDIDTFFPPSHSIQRRPQALPPFSVEPLDKKGPLPKHLPLPEFTAPGQIRRDGLPQVNPANVKVVRAPNVSDSEMPISHAPTITPQRINQVLEEYDSPAKGMGQKIFDLGVKYGINPAMALAFYIQESSAGTRGAGARNNSWGNIRQGRHGYKAYHNIEHGLVDWYERIHQHYVGKGFHTLGRPGQRDGIIHKYAPGSDGNNEGHYIRNVANMIRKWSY